MKRMYVVLGVMFFLLALGAFSCLADKESPPVVQHQKFDRAKRRMELRAEMHRRMREKILQGIGPDQDLFKDMDQMFEDSFSDSFQGFDSFDSVESSANFSTEWTESATGRTLVVTPKDPSQQLDIDVKNGMVTLKGKSETKSANGSFISNFENSFSVPGDCDADKVKMNQKDGKIILDFPYKSSVKKIVSPPKEERKPLRPPEGTVEI